MKRPNGLREWALFIFTAVGIIASIAVAYEALVQRVGVIEMKAEKAIVKDEFQDTAITELKTDVKYIRQGVDRIEEKLEK